MPYLNVKLCAVGSNDQSDRIASVLTDLTAEILRKKRELTAVAVEYVAPERWYVGGSQLAARSENSFYLDIKVTEGTNSKDDKALFVARVFGAFEAILGPISPASYVVIHEVHADAWGYQGQTQEFRYISGKAL